MYSGIILYTLKQQSGAQKMAKIKTYKVTSTKYRTGRTYEKVGTLADLIQAFSYTLECGASYQHEKGNKKINCTPKSVAALVNNLNNAVSNSAANGCASEGYDWEPVV